MATRPQYFPQFASLDVDLPETSNDNKLRPPLEIRETGYDFLQKVPAEEFNWLMNNISEWVQYLDDLARDQGITEIATKDQAEQGISISTLMTPQRTLQSIQYNAVPAGVVYYIAASTAPTGYLFSNGAAYSRTTYSRLFATIGTTFGAGDGSTTFNIPDLRDEFIRGASPGTREVGFAESDSLRSHNHTGSTASAGSHSHSGSTAGAGGHGHSGTTASAGTHAHAISARRDKATSGPYGTYGSGIDNGDRTTASAGAHAHTFATNVIGDHNHTLTINAAGTHSHTFTTNSTGGSETRPQNVALLPIIKF